MTWLAIVSSSDEIDDMACVIVHSSDEIDDMVCYSIR